jgi:hypothetical protein
VNAKSKFRIPTILKILDVLPRNRQRKGVIDWLRAHAFNGDKSPWKSGENSPHSTTFVIPAIARNAGVAPSQRFPRNQNKTWFVGICGMNTALLKL